MIDGWQDALPPVRAVHPLTDGMVGVTQRVVLADGRQVVAKRCPYPASVEADNLRVLAESGVPTAEVLAVTDHLLVLELLTGSTDWAAVGRSVALMHRRTCDRYGWHQHNTSGRFRQDNTWHDAWPSFYTERRVRAHLEDPVLPDAVRRRLHRACDGPLPALLPERPPASLTHGDLWSANVVAGRLIDPELSYADRELDLAFAQMTRSLPEEFFTAYLAELPTDPGYGDRRPALELHHRLLQVRHFGRDWLPGVVAVLDHYGW